MALTLHYLDGTGWVELDQSAYGFCMVKSQNSYSHPAVFSFRLYAPQHTRPIPNRALCYVYDGSTLVILGHVWEIKPTDSNIVDYVIYDVTMKARQTITIMSGPHGDPNVIPRRVDDVANDNDDDYAFENLHNATIGEIIADYMDNAYNELFTKCAAAPLVSPYGDPYVSSDLTPLDFIPQDKVVSESELLGQALERLLSRYPNYRILFTPDVVGTNNKWRFINIKECPEITLTLNDFSSGAKKVLSAQINPINDQKFTAYTIYGPQKIESAVVYVNDDSGTTSSDESGGLDELWSSGQAINFGIYGPGGIGTGDAGRKWQISDTAKRSIARLIPGGLVVPDSQYNVNGTSYMQRQITGPTLQVTFDDGATWWTATGLQWDSKTGIITTPMAMYQYDPSGSPSNPYKLPTNARLYYGYYSTPLSVRKPDTGYEGTCYTVEGIDDEKKEYDDMLAVGYEKGTPVTTIDRLAQYAKLAQEKLDFYKDLEYSGGCVIDGIDYDFLHLQKRISFTAVDGDGSSITTGWESIKAILTDVEYDYENQTTTLTWSSDKAQYLQQSTDALREALKIRALQIVQILESNLLADANGNISWASLIKYLIVDPTTQQQVGEF